MKRSHIVIGDSLVLALVTLIGFASHGEFKASFVPRMAAAFIPLALGWFLLAPWLGLFQNAVTSASSQLWRPSFVMLFAGSLAAILRGILLNAPVIPTFAIVLGATAAAGLSLWRFACLLLKRRDVRPARLAQSDQYSEHPGRPGGNA